MKESICNNRENLKITYFFGAGASYNSVPIWNEQGRSMAIVSGVLRGIFQSPKHQFNKDNVKVIADMLEFYSKRALEFGTLDIYARNLFLLDRKKKLNDLKYYLSIYFDMWESFIGFDKYIDEEKSIYYQKIDNRYFSLLAVLLEKGIQNPILKDSVSFISWNYDLQLEMAYKSFMNDSENQTLESINSDFNFFEEENDKKIIHLNGFRGVFNYKDKVFSNVSNDRESSLVDYLVGLVENKNQFRSREMSYSKNIKYSWEEGSKSFEDAKKIMSETNILIIIGYSFPTYNRKVDSELIKYFEKGSKTKKVIYQDPNPNKDLIFSIFSSSITIEYVKNPSQFYVPQDFLFPQENEKITFG